MIAAVSLQSAWHLGDQTERGSGERRPREEGREEGREREEGIPQKGVLAVILIVWEVPGSHFVCLGSWG